MLRKSLNLSSCTDTVAKMLSSFASAGALQHVTALTSSIKQLQRADEQCPIYKCTEHDKRNQQAGNQGRYHLAVCTSVLMLRQDSPPSDDSHSTCDNDIDNKSLTSVSKNTSYNCSEHSIELGLFVA